MTPTVLNRLAESLRERSASPDGQESPVAILWPDPKEEWRGLLPALRDELPELLALGDYDSKARVGPAIWLRCVVDGTLPAPGRQGGGDGAGPSGEAAVELGRETVAAGRPVPMTGTTPDLGEAHDELDVPILYLPGVAREDLRAGDGCPESLKPLVELMYRGTLWLHPKGRPWTPAAFLGSAKGLGLDVARDSETHRALASALPEVAPLEVAHLQGRRWDADDFDRLLAPDLQRDVLRWMVGAAGAREHMGTSRWRAFCARCRQELELDPEAAAEVDAAAKLGEGMGKWADVWDRFAEAPENHKGVVDVLRRSRPSGKIALAPDRWPDLNDEAETAARSKLAATAELSAQEARAVVAELEEEHGPRREWLWARLGKSGVAQVLEPLARLAAATESAIGGTAPDEAADAYEQTGWQADAAAREALARAAPQDEAMVARAVRSLLERWMDDTARAFQAAVERFPLPGADAPPLVEAGADECIVFVDGLRYELGRRVAERLEEEGCTARLARRWAALPTVTATGKPAVAPVADQVAGRLLGPDFRPGIGPADSSARPAGVARPADRASAAGTARQRDADPSAAAARPATAARLREAMVKRDYQVLAPGAAEMPLEADARGWTETGRIDKLGHDHVGDASGFAKALEAEIERIVQTVAGLLEVGWRSVRVVADHGWLWLPGGLPMVSLPKHLTASKWARCAVVAGESRPDGVLRFPWRWNADQSFAAPPGIACFSKRDEYAHGGVSIQECLTPDIRVERGSAPRGASASIRSVEWLRLRCVAQVEAMGGPATADLRVGGPSGPSAAHAPRPVAEDGSVSLVLAGDEHEDAVLTFVVVGEDGRVLAHQSTRPGAAS